MLKDSKKNKFNVVKLKELRQLENCVVKYCRKLYCKNSNISEALIYLQIYILLKNIKRCYVKHKHLNKNT